MTSRVTVSRAQRIHHEGAKARRKYKMVEEKTTSFLPLRLRAFVKSSKYRRAGNKS